MTGIFVKWIKTKDWSFTIGLYIFSIRFELCKKSSLEDISKMMANFSNNKGGRINPC